MNYYRILNLHKNATNEEIKKNYKILALKYHPDKNPEANGDMFNKIREAYEVLSDPYRRGRYDIMLEERNIFPLWIIPKFPTNFKSHSNYSYSSVTTKDKNGNVYVKECETKNGKTTCREYRTDSTKKVNSKKYRIKNDRN